MVIGVGGIPVCMDIGPRGDILKAVFGFGAAFVGAEAPLRIAIVVRV